MTIARNADMQDRLKLFREHLMNEGAQEAFDKLASAASDDLRYELKPFISSRKFSVKYLAGNRNPYAFIVNRSDLLFYFRQPSGQVSEALLGFFRAKGFDANINNTKELTVRLKSAFDSEAVLSKLSFEDVQKRTANLGDGSPIHLRSHLENAGRAESWSVDALRKATPEHIYDAVQWLLEGNTDHPFGVSTNYDLIADDGTRLPPNAVFGIAFSRAEPDVPIDTGHFTADEASTCFQILREAGYQIVPKGQLIDTWPPEVESEGLSEWSEGKQRLVAHKQRERGSGLATAKKSQFRRMHGRLFCERCKLDPVDHYRTDQAEACIEVHHSKIQVADMVDDHRTKLSDLQCLCANCHRIVHRELRDGNHESNQESSTIISRLR